MAKLSQRTQLFGTLGSPCCWDLAVIGRWKIGEPGREIPKYRCFPPLAFPNWGERETPPRPFVIPGKSSEQFVQQCTWDAFPRAGATWPCIYSPTALVVVNGEPFPGEEMTLRVCALLQLHHRERLLSVGFSGTQCVTALGRFKTMDAVSEPQTLAPNTLSHCACLSAACLTVLVSLCLSHCACLSAASQCVASF